MTSAASSRAAAGQRDLNQPRVSLASHYCSNTRVFSGSTSNIQSWQLRICNLIHIYIRGKRTQKVSFNFSLCPQSSTILSILDVEDRKSCAGVWYEWWWYMQSKICPRVHLKCPLPATGQPHPWSIGPVINISSANTGHWHGQAQPLSLFYIGMTSC